MSDIEDAVSDHARYMANCCGRHSNATHELAQLRKENCQLTDALYKEAKRTVEASVLISRVLYAVATDTLTRLDVKPYLEWVENFPKPPIISVTSPK